MWLHSLKVAQLLRSAACLHTNQSRSYLNHFVSECSLWVGFLGIPFVTMRTNHTELFSFLILTFLIFVYITFVGAEGYCCPSSHSTHTHLVGLLWMTHRPVGRPLPDNIQRLPETDIHAPRRDWNPQSPRESGGRPTPTRPLIQDFRT